jgi:hypothetical protein
MAQPLLHRRQLLRLAGLAGVTLLGGCNNGPQAQLAYGPGELPSAWLKTLPKPWQGRPQPTPEAVVSALGQPSTGLLLLSDGWALEAPRDKLVPFGAPELLAQLAPFAAPVSRLFQPEGAPALAFPWAFSTWVLVLRSRPDLARRRQEGWDLLLDPSLKDRLVLPSSPRVVIELVLRQLGLAPAPFGLAAQSQTPAQSSAKAPPGPPAEATVLDDPKLLEAVQRLRRQALACDEANGLNLLLAGEADAAVLPARRVLPLLRSDPRLEALLPESGSPLIWSLLLRPAAKAALPQEWLDSILKPPLLNRLLAKGWVPPLPAERLAPALAAWPAPTSRLLLPPPAVLARCTSLAPFSEPERHQWQQLWDRATPQHGRQTSA